MSKHTPCVLVQKGVLTSAAKTALRKAGYQVVEAEDVSKVQHFYPDNFAAASTRAKILAFDFHCGGGGPFNVDMNDMRKTYIHYLREIKAF